MITLFALTQCILGALMGQCVPPGRLRLGLGSVENAFPEEIKSGACIHQLCQALNFIVKAFAHALIPFCGEVREDGIVVFPQVVR